MPQKTVLRVGSTEFALNVAEKVTYGFNVRMKQKDALTVVVTTALWL